MAKRIEALRGAKEMPIGVPIAGCRPRPVLVKGTKELEMSHFPPPTEIEQAIAASAIGSNQPHYSHVEPTFEEIAREAYAIYLANGSRDGHDLEDWLEAERRLARHDANARQQDAAVVQHGTGESRQRHTRSTADRRRFRADVPNYIPV
jgi:hypothetical protein